MKTLIGFIALVLLLALLAYIVWSQIKKWLKKNREKKEIEERFQQLKADFEVLGKQQKDVLILFFDHGPYSEWGKKNKDEITCLNTCMEHLAQSIPDNNMDSDIFQISLIEKDVIRIRNRIIILKESGAL